MFMSPYLMGARRGGGGTMGIAPPLVPSPPPGEHVIAGPRLDTLQLHWGGATDTCESPQEATCKIAVGKFMEGHPNVLPTVVELQSALLEIWGSRSPLDYQD